MQARRGALARDQLIKLLRDYQDWSGVKVVVVFDGQGAKVTATADPGDIQVFYSRSGQTADSVIERLAGKYGAKFSLLVATGDLLERETASACGAECISTEGLRELLKDVRPRPGRN